jgi:DNA polymerase-3 subunit beta
MFFEIERDVFYEGLSKTVPIAEKKSPLPILSHILLNASNTTITLSATDLEVGLKMTYISNVIEPGVLAVPSKKIYEMVRELPPGIMNIKSTQVGNRIKIFCGEISFELAGMDAADYPTWSSFEDIKKFSVNSKKIVNMIDKTIFAASTDDSRFNLNGVLIEDNVEITRFVATDGHRLALIDENLGLSLDSKVIVPKKGLIELRRILENVNGDIALGFEPKNLCVSTDRFMMSVRLVDGDYPDYRKVIPPLSDKIIKSNRIKLLQALRRTAVLTSDTNKGVNIEVSQDTMIVSATHPDLGSARDVIAVEYKGEDFKVIINVFYMMEALGVLESELITFEFDKEGAPMVIRSDPPKEYFNLIMPMRK